MTEENHPHPVTLLDGGMGRELLRMQAPFQQPEWSALALIEAPELVKKAHEAFAVAGCDIITSNNYAVVPFHLEDKRFHAEGAALTALAGQLAREVATEYGCLVAGSIPPVFGSYRPDLFLPDQAHELYNIIVTALNPHVDFWLAETMSSIAEAQAIAEVLSKDKRPLWLSFTLKDTVDSTIGVPLLRSGEDITSAVETAAELKASAMLFNCSPPEVMAPAIEISIQERNQLKIDLPIGVYANAFPVLQKDILVNADLQEIRQDLDPEGYLDFARIWQDLGATIIGGCCGIGPEHIAALQHNLQPGKQVIQNNFL